MGYLPQGSSAVLTIGEKPDSSASLSLSLSVSAIGSSPAMGSLFPCRSVCRNGMNLIDRHLAHNPGKGGKDLLGPI